jgi:hypothetical protein
MCKEELNRQGGQINVDKWLAKGFAKWFQIHVRSLAGLFLQAEKMDDIFYVCCSPWFVFCRLEICVMSVLTSMLWRANQISE